MMSDKLKTIVYKQSPTARKFHKSKKLVRGFMGCVGNGKTVACIMEILRVAKDQHPNSEGIRFTRFIIARTTFGELISTTLKTWKDWMPESEFPVVMSPLIKCHVIKKLGDGTTWDMEVLFIPFEKAEDIRKAMSLEVTGFFFNEARFFPFDIIKAGRQRCGRYPAKVNGYDDVYENGKLIYDAPKLRDENGELILINGKPKYEPCKRRMVVMDTNPPKEAHWWAQFDIKGYLKGSKNPEADKLKTRKQFDFFTGPPPLFYEKGEYIENPEAENVENLPGGYQYYHDEIVGSTWDYINVMILGNYGMVVEGKPVFPEYNDRIHSVSFKEKGITVRKSVPICLGWDFGNTPACVIGQQVNGQIRIIWSLYNEGTNIREFARDIVKPFLQKNFSGCEIGFSLCDPAGMSAGQEEGKSCIGILNSEDLNMGFTSEQAPTNVISARLDAVSSALISMVGGEPKYLLNRDGCKGIRQGKMGGYHYARVKSSADVYKDKPEKNNDSHEADAEQYLVLGFQGGYVTEKSDFEEFNTPKIQGVTGYG